MRESKSGLYGPLVYTLANTATILPFLFGCALAFTLVIYWAIGLRDTADAFFRFLLYLFLALVAAESQAVAISAIIPIFVAALALNAFLNGLLMCTQGYFIRISSLPAFWYYSA